MAKRTEDRILDGALERVRDEATRMLLCSAEPTSYAEANSTYALADVTMSGSDFTIADGDSGGRKVTVGAKSSVTVDTTGTGTHVALVDVTNTRLLAVTTCTSQVVTSGNTVNFPAWKITINDPT